jgi:hypothetical protein
LTKADARHVVESLGLRADDPLSGEAARDDLFGPILIARRLLGHRRSRCGDPGIFDGGS